MDEQSLKDIVEDFVIPNLDEFIETESAFFVYIVYEDSDKGVKTLITPAPPFEVIDDVMKKVAEKVYEEMQRLPSVIVACEKVKFAEGQEIEDVDLLDSGLVIVALEAHTAEGLVLIYSMPDLELVISKELDMEGEEAPPYTTVAITSFMQETLVKAGLRKEENGESDGDSNSKAEIHFRFSRN